MGGGEYGDFLAGGGIIFSRPKLFFWGGEEGGNFFRII